ncbi:protein-L-isoaspartate(D-aspartate) O-methyltransferase-like isoform X2 [Gordionus sp. m RMFG-2023]|uniref:protein-L-isoaspartate(D-aspartate) O-methyltransferase-like isoform X2 n=1 Tax=Gordionus sp. m RMFG-2023 TaxID=3053472 RepID=UPI0031FCC86A
MLSLCNIYSFTSWAKNFGMAWRSYGSNNTEFINSLWEHGVIKSERIKEIMLQIDRKDFIKNSPYVDSPQSISYGVTISAPHMHAAALELLKDHLKPGDKALDIGSGSGYLTACMGMMVSPNGKAVGVEHIPELVESSLENIKKHHAHLLSKDLVKIIEGDGRLGYKALSPYNAIHVGAASPDKPKSLLDQLAKGGRLICPVGSISFGQDLMQYDKGMDGEIKEAILMGVLYVPLTDKEKQHNRSERHSLHFK